jgi:hypothetical protein
MTNKTNRSLFRQSLKGSTIDKGILKGSRLNNLFEDLQKSNRQSIQGEVHDE